MPIGGSGKTGRGLSRTGQPGGKRTGQRMSHYIGRLRAVGQGPTCGWLDGSLRRGFRSPEDWSEVQVHVRRSPGGGRGMWEQVWEPRLEVRVFSYGVLVPVPGPAPIRAVEGLRAPVAMVVSPRPERAGQADQDGRPSGAALTAIDLSVIRGVGSSMVVPCVHLFLPRSL